MHVLREHEVRDDCEVRVTTAGRVAIRTGLTVVLAAVCVDGGRAEAVAQLSQDDVAVAAIGTVLATVSAPGTLDSPPTVQIPLLGDAAQRQLEVKAGDHVEAGQELSRTDGQAAKQAVQHATDLLSSARDQLAAAKRGLTPERREVDRIQIAMALQDYSNARLALHQAEVRADFHGPDQELLVHLARNKLAATRRDVTINRSATSSVQRTITTTVQPPPTPPASGTTVTDSKRLDRQNNITALTQRSAVAASEFDLAQTEHQRASTRLGDLQQIQTLRASMITAWNNVRLAKANRTFNEKHEITKAKAAVADARQQIKDSNAALAGTVVRAPSRGTVVSIVPQGAREPSGMIVLADETHRSVTTHLDRADVGRIRAGEPAQVTFGKGTVVSGTVSGIDKPVGKGDEASGSAVHVKLDDNSGAARLGPVSSVRIITGWRSNVLAVPNGAIIRAGASTLIAVRRDGVLAKVPVTVGLVGDKLTEVTGGLLKPGDLVVVPDATTGVVPGLGLPTPR